MQGEENGGARGPWRDEEYGISSGQAWMCDLRSVCVHAILSPAYRGVILPVCTEKMICLWILTLAKMVPGMN